MDYKKVIDEQIEILQERQKKFTENYTSRNDIVCLIANTIAGLVEIGSKIKEPLTKPKRESNREDKKDVKEQKTTTEK